MNLRPELTVGGILTVLLYLSYAAVTVVIWSLVTRDYELVNRLSALGVALQFVSVPFLVGSEVTSIGV